MSNKHDDLVDIIERDIKETCNENPTIKKFIEYKNSNNTRVIGEIDLLCHCNNKYCVYEIKCCDSSENYKKAKQQLIKHKKHYFEVDEIVNYYYAHWEGSKFYSVEKVELKK